ncbi:MAG: ATP-binding protein [Maricaulaceae bacterium]
MPRTAGDVLRRAPALSPHATGETAYELFSNDPDLWVCAIVEDRRPVGLLNRDMFFRRLADQYGRALYARRPISLLMQKDPLVVEIDTPIDDLNALIITKRQSALMEGFIVAEKGVYRGVGTTLALFEANLQESETRNRELARSAESLRRAEAEARKAADAKAEFLATMSHEIRTPMNGVLGVVALLLGTELNDEQKRLAQTIRSSGELLLRLLNDVLDLSKIEAGKLELEKAPFSLRAMAQDAEALWSAGAQEKALAFSVRLETSDDLDTWVGDLVRLKQIVFNLIGNALKFTDQGSVTVRVSATEQDDQGRLRVEVKDTGVGIHESARGRIFSAFQQADATTTRRFGGTGLGLSISQRLVDLMGGDIGFESEFGQGSIFWFEVPLERATEPLAAAAPADQLKPLKRLRILVAEDHPVNQMVARMMIEGLGHECRLVGDGQAAAEAAHEQRWDVILMDVQMPVMDGLTATRTIRASEGPGANTPILALTANALAGDRERCLEAGMDGYIEKPIRIDALTSELARALAGRPCACRDYDGPACSAA